jgi:hypothetical protein
LGPQEQDGTEEREEQAEGDGDESTDHAVAPKPGVLQTKTRVHMPSIGFLESSFERTCERTPRDEAAFRPPAAGPIIAR